MKFFPSLLDHSLRFDMVCTLEHTRAQLGAEEPKEADFWQFGQRAALKLPAVGFATTTDVDKSALHPPDKQDIAPRLALEVRRLAYVTPPIPTPTPHRLLTLPNTRGFLSTCIKHTDTDSLTVTDVYKHACKRTRYIQVRRERGGSRARVRVHNVQLPDEPSLHQAEQQQPRDRQGCRRPCTPHWLRQPDAQLGCDAGWRADSV
jgi:hypothetical protein